MLRDGTFYQAPRANHFQGNSPEARAARLAGQITQPEFKSSVIPVEAEVLVSV